MIDTKKILDCVEVSYELGRERSEGFYKVRLSTMERKCFFTGIYHVFYTGPVSCFISFTPQRFIGRLYDLFIILDFLSQTFFFSSVFIEGDHQSQATCHQQRKKLTMEGYLRKKSEVERYHSLCITQWEKKYARDGLIVLLMSSVCPTITCH